MPNPNSPAAQNTDSVQRKPRLGGFWFVIRLSILLVILALCLRSATREDLFDLDPDDFEDSPIWQEQLVCLQADRYPTFPQRIAWPDELDPDPRAQKIISLAMRQRSPFLPQLATVVYDKMRGDSHYSLLNILCGGFYHDEYRGAKAYCAQIIKFDDPVLSPCKIDALTELNGFDRWSLVRQAGKHKEKRAVKPLLRSLPRSASWDLILALGQIDDSRAVEPLIKHLKETDSKSAMFALAMLGDARAVPQIRELLNSGESGSIRANAAIALGVLGAKDCVGDMLTAYDQVETHDERLSILLGLYILRDKRAAPLFVKVLTDEDTHEDKGKRRSGRSYRVGDLYSIPLIYRQEQQLEGVIAKEWCRLCLEKSISELAFVPIGELKEGPYTPSDLWPLPTRHRLIAALGLSLLQDKSITPKLIEAFKAAKSKDQKIGILLALRLLKDESSEPFLISVLCARPENGLVKDGALYALRDSGGNAYLPMYLKMLESDNSETRSIGIELLKGKTDPRILPAFVGCFKKTKAGKLSVYLVQEMQKRGYHFSLSDWRSMLSSEDEYLRFWAVTQCYQRPNGDLRQQFMNILLSSYVPDDLYGPDPEPWFLSSEYVAEHAISEDVDRLINALDSPNWLVSVMAAHTLGKIGNNKATVPLLNYLRTCGDRRARAIALSAIVDIGDPNAVGPLAIIAKEGYKPRNDMCYSLSLRRRSILAEDFGREMHLSFHSLHTAIASLGGDETFQILKQHFEKRQPTPQGMMTGRFADALDALVILGDKRAVPLLYAFHEKSRNKDVRDELELSLGDLGDERMKPQLKLLLRSWGIENQCHAAYALAKMGDERAFELLVKGVTSTYISDYGTSSVLKYLAKLDDPRAIVPLRKALADCKSYDLKERIGKCLAKLESRHPEFARDGAGK